MSQCVKSMIDQSIPSFCFRPNHLQTYYKILHLHRTQFYQWILQKTTLVGKQDVLPDITQFTVEKLSYQSVKFHYLEWVMRGSMTQTGKVEPEGHIQGSCATESFNFTKLP